MFAEISFTQLNLAQDNGGSYGTSATVDPIVEQHERVMGDCVFDPSLSPAQREGIVSSLRDAFTQILDVDMLRHASTDKDQAYIERDGRTYAETLSDEAMQTFKANDNFCFQVKPELSQLLDPQNPKRQAFQKFAESSDPAQQAQGRQMLGIIEKVEQAYLVGLTALDIGLLRGVEAVRNDQGMLEVGVSWCVTKPLCPSSKALQQLVEGLVAWQYQKVILSPEYWSGRGVDMPEDMAQVHMSPKKLQPMKGGLEVTPWKVKDIDPKVYIQKSAALGVEIDESIRKAVS